MNDQNRNSIFSTVLVLIIGIIGLYLLLGFVSGNGLQMNANMMGENDMMGSRGAIGYSTGSTLVGLLALLIKLFIIGLVIVFIIGAIVWLRDTFFKNNNFKFSQLTGNDPIMKLIVYGSLSILGLALVLALFGRYSYTNMSINSAMGSAYYTQSYGFAGLIGMLIKLFTFILVASLAIAAVIYLKNQFEQGNLTIRQGSENTTVPQAAGMEAKDLDQVKFSGEATGTTQINPKKEK